MSERILVPVDGSPLSQRALEVACEEFPHAKIIALHVIDPAEPGYSIYGSDHDLTTEPRHGSEAWYERAHELTDDLFETITDLADEHDVDLETATVVGRPDREIIDYAADEDVDHVIIGSHGRTKDARVMLGSITEAIAFRAPMRVTLIRGEPDLQE